MKLQINIFVIALLLLISKSVSSKDKESTFHKSYYKNCIENKENKENHEIKYNACLANAILNNQKELIDLILSKKPDVNYPDEKGYTPLYYAAYFGDLSLMQNLISMDAKTEQTFNGKTIQEIYNEKYLEKDNDPYLSGDTNGLIKPIPKVHLQLTNIYPQQYKHLGIDRTVLLKLKIFKTGRVDSVEVLSKDVEQAFIDVALLVISRTTFSPAVYKEEKVNSILTFPIYFSLDN